MCDKKSVYVRRGGEERPEGPLFKGGVSLRVLKEEEDGGVRGLPELDRDLGVKHQCCLILQAF